MSNNKLKPRREPITIGTAVPLFELADQKGSLVTAAELIGKGDAVLVFSPGNAAPEARAIPAWVRDHRQAMADRGCELLIVTPDAADANASLAQTEAMRVAILSDSGRRVAAAFGLAKVNAAWVVIVGREGRVIHSEGRLPDRTELITALMVRSGAKGDSFADLLK